MLLSSFITTGRLIRRISYFRGSLCLLDFVQSLPVSEGPPLYLIYSRKAEIVDREGVIDEYKGWLNSHEPACDFVTVSDVVIPKADPNLKKKKEEKTDPPKSELPKSRNPDSVALVGLNFRWVYIFVIVIFEFECFGYLVFSL